MGLAGLSAGTGPRQLVLPLLSPGKSPTITASLPVAATVCLLSACDTFGTRGAWGVQGGEATCWGPGVGRAASRG